MDPSSQVGNEFNGSVKSYSALKGYGFITTPDLQGDVFFAHKNLPKDVYFRTRDDYDFSLQGYDVGFKVALSEEGKATASDVWLLSELPPAPWKGGGKGFNSKGKGGGKGYDDWGYSKGGGKGYDDWGYSGGKGNFSKGGGGGGKGYGGGPPKTGAEHQEPGEPMLDGRRVQAKMKSYSRANQWGFAVVEESEGVALGDVFVHLNNLDQTLANKEMNFKVNDAVEFRLENVKGKTVAKDVTVVPQEAWNYNGHYVRGAITAFNDGEASGLITCPRIWGELSFGSGDLPKSLINGGSTSAMGKEVMCKCVVENGHAFARLVNPLTDMDGPLLRERMAEIVADLFSSGFLDAKANQQLGETLPGDLRLVLPELELHTAENASSFILGALSRRRMDAEGWAPSGGGGKGYSGGSSWDSYGGGFGGYSGSKGAGGYGGGKGGGYESYGKSGGKGYGGGGGKGYDNSYGKGGGKGYGGASCGASAGKGFESYGKGGGKSFGKKGGWGPY